MYREEMLFLNFRKKWDIWERGDYLFVEEVDIRHVMTRLRKVSKVWMIIDDMKSLVASQVKARSPRWKIL